MSTSRWIELGAAAPLAVATGLLVYSAYRWVRSRRVKDPRLCPGPERPKWECLDPRNWLARRACGYDLSGLPRDEAGGCTCPECGRRITPALPLARIVMRWRLAPAAVVLLAVAAAMWNVRWIRQGGWVKYTPTTILIGLQRSVPWFVHEGVRWRLATRLEQGQLWEVQKRWLIPAAINALGADTVRWNADWGDEVLSRIGDASIPALEAALRSEDYQRRQMAAYILRRRADPDPERRWRHYGSSATVEYRPCDDLLRVSVEGLRDDKMTAWALMANAQDGFEFLQRYPDRTTPFLREGLSGADDQQRWLCAGLAALAGSRELADIAGPMLVEQLRDDQIRENAKAGVVGLMRMGWAAVKPLQRCYDSPDRQQRTLARLILLDIASRTDFTDDVERRCELLREAPEITSLTRHPIPRLAAKDLVAGW